VLLRQRVDARRFACVGAAYKSNFGHIQAWQVLELGRSRQELGGVKPAHGNFGGGFFIILGANFLRGGGCGHGVLVKCFNIQAAGRALNPL